MHTVALIIINAKKGKNRAARTCVRGQDAM